MSLCTLRRAARWETFALLAVLLILAFVFAWYSRCDLAGRRRGADTASWI
jgi:uncharacterized membrane protein (DUF373 family)